MNKLLGLLSLVVLWGNAAIADTVDVNTFNALNTAVGEAASPRTINILDNLTSTANMNVQSAADLTINGNNFTLSGYTGYSNASGFRLINGNTLTLENINMDSFKSSNKGGAIYNDNSSSVTIGNNASFTSNTSANGGGAIYNGNSSSVTIGNNASFTSNTSTNGGGAIYGSTGSTTTLNTGSGLTTFSGNTDYRGPNDIYLYDTAKLNISGTGEVLFGSGIASSNTNAVINQNSTGNMTLESTANNANFQGTFTQTAGKTTVLGSFFNNTSANNIITNNSILDMSQAADRTINRITIDNAALSAIGGGIQAYTINNLSSGSGTANFDVDIDGLAGTSDTFAITNAGSGTLNIANFHLVNAPTAESIPLTIFSGNISGYTFTTSKTEVTTPVYNYKFRSDGGGTYSLLRGNFNTEVFRGQASKLAAYQNQLIVNNTLFDHVYLDSNERTAGLANKYAAGTEMFAPYQFTKKDGAIWTKTYATFERLSMTHGLNVANNAYGQIIGADFPVVELSKGWKFLPTAYISYNGGHQTFNGVSMYQNGGQGGFMGTFNKGDFIGSVLAYGGGYNNEMSLAGNTENTGNWFAGTAVKGAYNFHPFRNFIIQPNLLASYNIFGKQNWYSNYGALSMNSGLLNGINVAPGLNLIYGRETWSVYLTALYMYNINDSVGGRAGSVNLPGLSMRHGYLEYGIGATKTWQDRLSSYVQFVIRNGGRTGVGFQLGLTWKL